jgi:hypothetical protein
MHTDAEAYLRYDEIKSAVIRVPPSMSLALNRYAHTRRVPLHHFALVSDVHPHPVAATASSKLNKATKFCAAGTYAHIFLINGSMQERGSGKPAVSYLILFLRLLVQICVA